MDSLRTAAIAAVAATLCACGGGGGGGSGGGNSGAGSAGTLSVSSNSLTFIANGPNSATPAPQTVSGTVTGISSGTLYITITGTGTAVGGISQVLMTGNDSGQSSVSVPAPSSLGVGTYTGVISVQACLNDATCQTGKLNGSPQTINVTYYVAALQTSVSSLNYTVTNSSTASDLSQQTIITGIPAQTWSATTDADWLTITPSGKSGDTLTATINQSELDNMIDGANGTTITVTPGTAGQPISIPVSLTVKRTEVDYVSPYVTYTGTSGSVVISGAEFSQVTISGVMFGSTPAPSFTQIGPNLLRATLPATLAPGRYPVTLQTDASGVKQLAQLVVVDAPTFSAAALALPSNDNQQPFAIVYDAERAAVGIDVWHQNTGNTGLVRFVSTAGAWQPPVEKSGFDMFGIALSADGTQWIAGSAYDVLHLDANDLSTQATVSSPLNHNGLSWVTQMAVASDGTIAMFGDIVPNGCGALFMVYDPRRQSFTTPSYTGCEGYAGASADGTRLLVGSVSSSTGTNDVFEYNTSTGTLDTTGVLQFVSTAPVLDGAGDRIVLAAAMVYGATYTVYDGSYTALGTLPTTTLAVALSPDGTRAYTYDQVKTLRTFDLTATPLAGVFPEVGTGTSLAGDPGSQSPQMTITPDGRTVFITGGAALIVQPTPP